MAAHSAQALTIVIPGGSGQVGTILARRFHQDGHHVVVLSRRAPSGQTRDPWRHVVWDGASTGEWAREINGSDVVINLAGRSVNCRYTPAHRAEILQSRVQSTSVVGQAIARASRPPRLWLQASTATIYAHRFDAPNNEATGEIGGHEPGVPDSWRFSIEVSKAWEQAFDTAVTPSTRKVALRSALTLSPDPGGVFDTLRRLARRGLGGRAGDGRQFVSWIHHEDFVAAVEWLIHRSSMTGAVNVASPHPVPNDDFMRELRRACGAPFGLPASRWMLELGAVFMRTETELLLKSRRVIPTRLLDDGFAFRYPHWPDAARALCLEA